MSVHAGDGAKWRIAGLVAVLFFAGSLPVALRAEAAPGVRILYAETVEFSVPASHEGQRKTSAAELRQLQFTAYGRAYSLSIESNETFHASLAQKPHRSSLKLYRGSIDGLPNSWVRLATKGVEVHGMLWDGAHTYVIAPSAQIHDQSVSPPHSAGGTSIFRLGDVLVDSQHLSCGTEAAAESKKASHAYDALIAEIAHAKAEGELTATLRLEIAALGDSLYLERYADEQEARDAMLLRLNNVDGIFSAQLGMQIQVPTARVHSQQDDPFSDVTKPSSLLAELADLRRNSADLRSHGLTHLFTGRDLDGTTIGIAYMDALCDSKFGVGLTEVSNRGAWYESLVAAHEIGHNFGAVHDGQADKACASTPQNLFLMSPNVSGVDEFSQCSLQSMQPSIDRAQCIRALPPANISVPVDLGTIVQPVGAAFEWELAVSNSGGVTATGIRADLLVPPSVTVEDAYVVGGSCTSGAGVIQCQLGDLQGGTSRTVHLQLRGDTAGSNSISAEVSAQQETTTADNAGSGTLTIEAEADVSVALQSPTVADTGSSFDFHFTVTNAATIAASELVTVIELPPGMTATNATQSGADCSVASDAVVCQLTALAAGDSSDGQVSLSAAQAGTAVLRVAVSGGYVDPDASNDSAEVTIHVTGSSPVGAVQATSSSGGSGGGGGSGSMLFLAVLGLLGFAARIHFPHSARS